MGTGLLHLIVTAASTIGGAMLKMMAQKQAITAANQKMTLEALTAKSKIQQTAVDSARADQSAPTNQVRRFLVIMVVTAAVASMFIGAFVDTSTFVPVTQDSTWSFLIFNGGHVETVFQELKGVVILPEILLILNSISGLYLGQSIVKQ